MDQLERLKLFVLVTEAGNFSVAAKSLNLAQSQVSKAVKALEEEFRVTLFNRTTRKISLTDEGARLLAHAKGIVERYTVAEEDVRGEQAEPRGTLRILTSDGTGRAVFMPYVAAFLKRYPLLKIDHVMTDRFIDLAENNIDVALWISELKDSAYKARRIGLARRVTVATPAYLKRKGRPRTPLDLAAHECICFSRLGEYTHHGICNHWVYRDKDGIDVRVTVSGRFATDNSSLVRDAVLQHLGIYHGPNYVFREDLEIGRVVMILEDYELQPWPIYVIYPSMAFLPTRLRVMIDFLADGFSRDPWVKDVQENSHRSIVNRKG